MSIGSHRSLARSPVLCFARSFSHTGSDMHDDEAARRFCQRWSRSHGAERANAQSFFLELCDLLDVPRPDPSADASPDYRFEKAVEIHHPDGHVSADFIDFYRRGCFVCEAKQALAPEAGGPGIKRARAAQIQSVRDAAAARTDTFDSRDLAAAFTGAPTASLRRHLDTLEALGLLTGFDAPRGRRWSAR